MLEIEKTYFNDLAANASAHFKTSYLDFEAF